MSQGSYVVLFDLDGVIADWSHRLPLGIGSEAFYEAMPNDPVLSAGATIYNLLATQCRFLGHAIRGGGLEADVPFVDIMSCRPEKARTATVAWLETNGLIMPRNLHLRADDDKRPYPEIKLDMYRQFYEGRESVLALFEDNARTIEVFKGLGISCFRAESALDPAA